MAPIYDVYHVAKTGELAYVYPVSKTLADWLTYRVQLVEDSAPDTGRYYGEVDLAVDRDWVVFYGSSQPASWSAAKGKAVPVMQADDRDGENISKASVFSGITSLAGWLRSALRKDYTTDTEIGGDFDSALNSLEALTTESGSGTGNTFVNHDTGGTDNFRYVDADGNGIDGATIEAYLKEDYDSDNFSLKGRTRTNVHGRWVSNLSLDTGNTYTIVFYKDGVYGVSAAEVVL